MTATSTTDDMNDVGVGRGGVEGRSVGPGARKGKGQRSGSLRWRSEVPPGRRVEAGHRAPAQPVQVEGFQEVSNLENSTIEEN